MIIFEGRFKKQIKLLKERKAGEGGTGRDDVEMGDLMEKGDLPAMIISALLTIVPIALLVLVGLSLAGYFFIVR